MNAPRLHGRSRDHAPRDPHAHARRLLSDRIAEPLDATAAAELDAHLADCARCRSVERAYEEGGRAIRGLRPSVPPRDLGARVSAALDAEVRRGHRPSRAARPGPGARLIALATTASLGFAMLVVSGRLFEAPILRPPAMATLAAAVAEPTPFAVPTGELAFVDVGSDGLTVYQASVSLVCPPSAVDCATADYQVRPVAGMPQGLVPRGIALDRASRRMALLAENALGADSVSVVVLPPMDPPGAGAPREAGPGPDGRWPAWPAVEPSPGPLSPEAQASDAPGGPSPLPGSGEPSVLAILDDVQAVGAPPAWSEDGLVLAFSAMPADRSRGPDVYIWRPGDARAHRVTDDHASWFASWSGARMVLSRVAGQGDHRTATTVLLDATTGEATTLPLADAWLPAVDPSGRFAVAWRGTLTGNGPTVRARAGGLALLDWAAIDPPADGHVSAFRGAAHRARGGMHTSATGRTLDAVTTATAADPDDAWLEAIELPSTEGSVGPGLDWQVRWATEGTTFGYWVADASGASWGRLTVLRVLPDTGRIDRQTELLAPTLARRSFTLGVDRVAWVAPADEGADGELRVRTWGLGGEGGLRIREIRLRQGIPAF